MIPQCITERMKTLLRGFLRMSMNGIKGICTAIGNDYSLNEPTLPNEAFYLELLNRTK